MFYYGVKCLIYNRAVIQCGRAKVLSATCTLFHFECVCAKKLVILDGSCLRHSACIVLFLNMPQDLTVL